MVELVAKLVLGGGLFALLITEVVRMSRDHIRKKRWKKEIAWELFFNEVVIQKIISDFKGLRSDPIGYLNASKFRTYIMDSILSSGFLVYLDFKLAQFILVYRQRFNKIQYELDVFYRLKDDEKIKVQNLEHLRIGESDSELLLRDFKESKELQKLKKKYLHSWCKEQMKKFEEKRGKKFSKKEKKQALEITLKFIEGEIERYK